MWTITTILLCLDVVVPIVIIMLMPFEGDDPDFELTMVEKIEFSLFRLWVITLTLTPIFGFANALYWYKCCSC